MGISVGRLVDAVKGLKLNPVSKVVDADGKLPVAYHGSDTTRITKFNTNAEENVGERGTFFSAKRGAADEYGGSVYEAYLAIQNPYEVSSNQWALGEGLTPVKARKAGYDGYIIRGLDGKDGDAFMAFHPEQIKSATGNNGDFDPANSDIAFSRTPAAGNQGVDPSPRAALSKYTKIATDKLTELYSHPGKISLWDKTVGSMYHLAERSAPFKRVFTTAQNFFNDVSYYAICDRWCRNSSPQN